MLPVIYGDRFVARFDPAWDRKKKQLTITNWWWEEGVKADDEMYDALVGCFSQFVRYLDAHRIELGEQVASEASLRWVQKLPEFAG